MIRVSKDIHIDRPREEVFDFIANAQNEGSWNAAVISIAKLSPGAVGQGTRFTGQYRRVGRLDTELTTFDRPDRLGFHSEGRMMAMNFSFTFTPRGQGTAIEAVAEVYPRGVLKVMGPLLGPLLQREFATRGPAMKRALEGA